MKATFLCLKMEKPIVIMLLGCTRQGKSSLGNVLLGLNPNNNNEQGFKAAPGSHRVTTVTKAIDGFWLGKKEPSNAMVTPITVIDTPGYFDGEGRNKDHSKNLVEAIKKDVDVIHIFLWVKKASDCFTEADKEFFKLMCDTFGKDVFTSRTIMILTQWVH